MASSWMRRRWCLWRSVSSSRPGTALSGRGAPAGSPWQTAVSGTGHHQGNVNREPSKSDNGGATVFTWWCCHSECGGYGAIYCTNGSHIQAEHVRQSDNPRGCGVFVLHDSSRVSLNSSEFNGNKWSGFGCRWGGGGEVTNCRLDSNGQGAWAIRKSTIKGVVRVGNRVTNDFTDTKYKQVRQSDRVLGGQCWIVIRLHSFFPTR